MAIYFSLLALNLALHMDTYATNGTFQLYNPLLRIAEGQIIAKDFPFFHGVGIPLLHYPLFAMMGKGVFAAEFVKNFVSTAVFLLATLLFFYAYFKNAQKATIASAAFTILALCCVEVVLPGNSLIGLRTAMPILAAAFMLWRPDWSITVKGRRVKLYYSILSILLGLGVACGTEQGLAASVAFGLVELTAYMKHWRDIRKWWWRYLVKIGLVGISIYTVLTILTLGHAQEALRYALLDVPKDQGWYFGMSPNDFLSPRTWHWLLDELPYGILCLSVVLYATVRNHISSRQKYAAGFLATYGLIVFLVSATGYWFPKAQLQPLYRVLSMLLVAYIISCLFYFATNIRVIKVKKKIHLVQSGVTSIATIILTIIIMWSMVNHLKMAKSLHPVATLTHAKEARHSNDDAYISSIWQKRLAAFKPYITQADTIWETYGSIYSTTLGRRIGPIGGEDYIIHALGKDRRASYANDFIHSNAQFAITLKPTYFYYEEWLWIRHWDFYKHLFTNYEIIADNDAHILWKRQPSANQAQSEVPLDIKHKPGQVYRIDAPQSNTPQLLEIELHYKPQQTIPVVSSKLSRYSVSIEGSSAQRYLVSLPPYETIWRFPVIVMPGDSHIDIRPAVEGFVAKSENLSIKSITAKKINTTPPQNLFAIYNNFCSFGGSYNYTKSHGGQYKNLRCTIDEISLKHYQKHIQK
ncbi:MAG: hypothetical protein Q4B06_02745 [Candidatus Saccharibacteria bacterium]|nr:hypothetical protein [Candidatus Saccharibacteria bacterium]